MTGIERIVTSWVNGRAVDALQPRFDRLLAVFPLPQDDDACFRGIGITGGDISEDDYETVCRDFRNLTGMIIDRLGDFGTPTFEYDPPPSLLQTFKRFADRFKTKEAMKEREQYLDATVRATQDDRLGPALSRFGSPVMHELSVENGHKIWWIKSREMNDAWLQSTIHPIFRPLPVEHREFDWDKF